jgi:hypothetical protein
MGLAPAALRAMAEHLLPCGPLEREPAVLALLLGSLRRAGPFLREGRGLGLRLLMPLICEDFQGLESIFKVVPEDQWTNLFWKILDRLGYPFPCGCREPRALNLRKALSWLDADLGVMEWDLGLRGLGSSAPAWRNLIVDRLFLADARGPRELGHASTGTWWQDYRARATRLFRVGRLQHLTGLDQVGSLVAVACPELLTLDFAPPTLVLKGCPALRTLPAPRAGHLLHVEDCAGLRSLAPERMREPGEPRFGNVRLIRCSELAELPTTMTLTGSLLLRGIGPLRAWPEDLHVGGDLRLRDCPAIEELPALTVQGSLRVEGASGLRRLAPGTVVGRHLDLRACGELEDLPWGVKVGGTVFLPEHLHRRAPEVPVQEPLLEVPEDRYPPLWTLLLGLKFPGLAPSSQRAAARDEADAVLVALRRELRENPRLEPELLWTASEVWRDLAEAWWAEQHPWEGHWNESDEDLPLAWFRGLLLAG